ncbi:lung adenoma susceptibility protein 2 [Aegotheles albertisi]
MTSSIKESSDCSPESTVSSLLTSCSIDSNNPYSNDLIHYKDKLYSSASEALEAYIEDFDLSLTSPEVSTGKISICQSTPKQIKLSKRCAKAKHALEDFSWHPGWGSLASPHARQAECDPDMISLATDDLLEIPGGELMPFVQSTSLKSKHQSSEWNRQLLQTSFCLGQTPSLSAGSCSQLQEDWKAPAHQNPHKDFSEKKNSVCTPDPYDSGSSKGSLRPLSFEENSNACPVKNYPWWLTSHRSDFSISGISSIPNVHYPIWLKSYSLFSDSTKESHDQNLNVQGKASSSQTTESLKERPSVDKDGSKLFRENDCLDLRGDKEAEGSCSSDSPDTCFPFDEAFSNHTEKPFREDQLELLTLKADRGLESSTEEPSNNLESDGSPSASGAERSWEKAPGAFNPAVPMCCEDVENALTFPKVDIIHKFLEDCLNDKNKEHSSCGVHHHRPVEALKLMLFKLQAIRGSLSQNETNEQKEEFEKLSKRAEAELQLCASEIIPLTNSVQKTLHHLVSHLKSLIEDNSNQQEQTKDDEDKGIICEADV